jgi:hypothetical protein
VRVAILFLIFVCPLIEGAEPSVQPVTVCEVMQNLSGYDGKVVAVVGRYSSRTTGRWLGEQKCGQKLVIGDQQWPNALWLAYDPASAPQPPAVLAVDATVLAQKLRTVKLGTLLTKLRFGSSDYDNWAVVYGRVETRKDLVTVTASGTRKNGFGYGASSPARLVFHGDAVVIFLNEDATKPASQ